MKWLHLQLEGNAQPASLRRLFLIDRLINSYASSAQFCFAELILPFHLFGYSIKGPRHDEKP